MWVALCLWILLPALLSGHPCQGEFRGETHLAFASVVLSRRHHTRLGAGDRQGELMQILLLLARESRYLPRVTQAAGLVERSHHLL